MSENCLTHKTSSGELEMDHSKHNHNVQFVQSKLRTNSESSFMSFSIKQSF